MVERQSGTRPLQFCLDVLRSLRRPATCCVLQLEFVAAAALPFVAHKIEPTILPSKEICHAGLHLAWSFHV
jgi:hypothetical protein